MKISKFMKKSIFQNLFPTSTGWFCKCFEPFRMFLDVSESHRPEFSQNPNIKKSCQQNLSKMFDQKLIKNLEFRKSQHFEKNTFPKIVIFDRKNIFSSNIIFSYFVNKLCSILTKYEGITPKTPKVILFFR